ncbi:MAG: hypothetical protein ACYCX7_09735, partial [Solirubrobacteraceae bacterium]
TNASPSESTATHSLVEGQDTLVSFLPPATGTDDQVAGEEVGFAETSASPPPPTATQSELDAHESASGEVAVAGPVAVCVQPSGVLAIALPGASASAASAPQSSGTIEDARRALARGGQ